MIVFELTMPQVNTWNGHWSGEGQRYIRTKREHLVPEEIWGKEFFYRWPDGWGACVSVKQMPAKDAERLMKLSAGFLGYDWMIDSLIADGYIHPKEK